MLSPLANRPFVNDRYGNPSPLCTMEWMYDHFYKILWKLLRRVSHPAEGKNPASYSSSRDQARGRCFTLAFAGCREGDGASTMAFNFASAFASYSAKRILLIDGNVREPILHLQFPNEKREGLTDLVEGRSSVDESVLEISPGRYYFLRSGAKSVNPVMLYESEDFLSVMQQLRTRYDLIIFDCPPLVDNPESVMLASSTDGLIVILQAGKTRWETALAAERDLQEAGVPILGAILNKKQQTIPESIYRLL